MLGRSDTLPIGTPIDVKAGLAQEMALLDSVVNGETHSGFFIWRANPAIVVPRSLANKPKFPDACERLAAEDYPVIIRATGGDLTPQSPGLINVALAFRQQRSKTAIRDSYLKLCTPLIDWLEQLGVEAYCGSVQGAFCDGEYNLVVDGRKLAGTAQRWRKMDTDLGLPANSYAVLVHAVLLIDDNLSLLWDKGNDFYRYCGLDNRIDKAKHVALAELLPAERQDGLVQNSFEQLHRHLAAFDASTV